MARTSKDSKVRLSEGQAEFCEEREAAEKGRKREKSNESCPQNHGESNHNYYSRRIDCGSR